MMSIYGLCAVLPYNYMLCFLKKMHLYKNIVHLILFVSNSTDVHPSSCISIHIDMIVSFIDSRKAFDYFCCNLTAKYHKNIFCVYICLAIRQFFIIHYVFSGFTKIIYHPFCPNIWL